MNDKKSKAADLEKKRALFFSVGVVICASMVLMAFTYSSAVDGTIAAIEEERGLEDDYVIDYDIPEEPEPEPEQEELPPPPPPPIQNINIVQNDQEVDEFEFGDLEEEEQWEEPEFTSIVEEPPTWIPDKEPEFPGGEVARQTFIVENTDYPMEAVEMGEQGTVYVHFVVGKDGKILDLSVVRGVSESIDKEALRVARAMPKWIPGEVAGKPVKCHFNMPITFTLGN